MKIRICNCEPRVFSFAPRFAGLFAVGCLMLVSSGCVSQSIYDAAVENDVTALKKYYAKGEDMNRKNQWPDSKNPVSIWGGPIMGAIVHGSFDAAAYLYSIGATNQPVLRNMWTGSPTNWVTGELQSCWLWSSYNPFEIAVLTGHFDIAREFNRLGEPIPKDAVLIFHHNIYGEVATNICMEMFSASPKPSKPFSWANAWNSKEKNIEGYYTKNGEYIGHYERDMQTIVFGGWAWGLSSRVIVPGSYAILLSYKDRSSHTVRDVEYRLNLEGGKIYVIVPSFNETKTGKVLPFVSKSFVPNLIEYDCRTGKGITKQIYEVLH